MEKKLQVLLLDDEPIVCKRLKPALEKDGLEVEVFNTSKEAMKRMDEKEFDVVVTDYRVDETDGIDILEYVTARSDQTKVILITAYASVELAHEAIAKGAYDIIAKPFKPNDLRKIVTRATQELIGGRVRS